MTVEEIDTMIQNLVNEYKRIYHSQNGVSFETRRKMMQIASQLSFLLEEKRKRAGWADKQMKPEYMEYRCCMCPNINKPETQCPPGPLKPKVTPCRFVKTYVDNRGWKYRVMGGIGGDVYKARYQKPEKAGWHCMRNLEWRKSFDEAQSDLNMLAKAKGWKEAQPCE
ncbi:hypothetical protein [Thermoanaerobacterium sp. DL9XJH110]|uniref:hypothetical protein n=1 Tax=Thermoanaerobacterium sp. DL9XJH110 TaxID=3386643 RepID=UPI003BB6C86F